MEKFKLLEKNLTFSEALVALKEGKWIRVPEWKGYWFLEAGIINVMRHDGEVGGSLCLEATVLREDWQIIELSHEFIQNERNIFAKTVLL